MQIKLSDFRVGSYRSLEGLKLPGLTQVNVVTGSNGVGKTAVLEALWLFTGRYNSPLLWNENVQRSSTPLVDPVAPLSADGRVALYGTENGIQYEHEVAFLHYTQPEDINVSDVVPTEESPIPLHIVGKLSVRVNGKELTQQAIRQTPTGLVMACTETIPRANCIIEGTRWQLESSGEDMKRYSDLVEKGKKDDLRDALRLIHPKLKDVEMLSNERGPYLSGLASDGRRYPLQAFGGGMMRLFRIYLAAFSSQNSVVLIDEIENGWHYSHLIDLWRRIRDWSNQWSVQVFASTHSRECLSAAVEAFKEQEEGLTIFNLYRRDGILQAATFTGEPLLAAQELRLELR